MRKGYLNFRRSVKTLLQIIQSLSTKTITTFYRRVIGIVAVENKTAFGPVKAVGYRPIGLYCCLRLGPWQWDWQQMWSDESLPILTKEKLER